MYVPSGKALILDTVTISVTSTSANGGESSGQCSELLCSGPHLANEIRWGSGGGVEGKHWSPSLQRIAVYKSEMQFY